MSNEGLVGAMLVGFVLWTGLAILFGLSIGTDIGEHKARVEAVEQGHAHWNIATTGSTTFEWNPKQ